MDVEILDNKEQTDIVMIIAAKISVDEKKKKKKMEDEEYKTCSGE